MDERKIYSDGVHSIANDEYHSSSGVSRSSLWEFKRSPYHYWHRYLNGGINLQESTPSMVMGNLVHTMVLEPHKFDSEFVMRPEMDRRTNAGKQAFNAFTMTLAGRQSVTYEQVEHANAIQKAIIENDLAFALLQDCKIEQSIYFTHQATGIQCKCRPDAWNGSIVIDLKTTADASYRAFQSSAFKYGYFLQAGFIHQGLNSIGLSLEKFVFMVVEKESPHAVALYVLDDEAIDFGVNQFNTLLESYAQCQQNDKWPSFGLQVLTIPNYAQYEVIETEFEHE